jgi:hypothetical protein
MNRSIVALAATGLLAWFPAPGTPVQPRCVYRADGALPDPGCTPGVLNPAVTQQTIRSTICRVGWTASIRPPSSATRPWKIAAVAAYGGHNVAAYHLDHLVPLSLGGHPTDARNLWPLRWRYAYAKDGRARRLLHRVCAGRLSLTAARWRIRHDWRQIR